jgi:UDP-N-acetylglucosamine 1-carboxyvinyltransferase
MVEYLRVEGGRILGGEVRIDTAKNAVLPILAACVMIEEPVTLLCPPNIVDVHEMINILKTIGCKVTYTKDYVTIDASGELKDIVSTQLTTKLRSSLFLAGPMLVRNRRVTLGTPGGCQLGDRKTDLHQAGLCALGAEFSGDDTMSRYVAGDMRGAEIELSIPSVGATENIMMAAALTPGITVIEGAAREPEIVDLARFLNTCGAKIAGAGKKTITVRGVDKLHGAEFKPISDRIVTGTLIASAAITGGELCMTNVPLDDVRCQLAKFRDMGLNILETSHDKLIVKAPKRLRALPDLLVEPHPGFPTDMQAIMLALASVADGTSTITEKVFNQDRFAHVPELEKLGARITVSDNVASVAGVHRLRGGNVKACDLRAGAALVVAALQADGITVIENTSIIDRGYTKIEEMLRPLGADIRRIVD